MGVGNVVEVPPRSNLHDESDIRAALSMQTRWFLHLRGAWQQQTRCLPHFSSLRFSKPVVCNTFGLVLGLKTVATCRFVESGARKLLKMTGLWVGFPLDVGNVREVSVPPNLRDESDIRQKRRMLDVGNVREVSVPSNPHDDSDNRQERRMLDVGNVVEVPPRSNLHDESDIRSRSCATHASIARDSRLCPWSAR